MWLNKMMVDSEADDWLCKNSTYFMNELEYKLLCQPNVKIMFPELHRTRLCDDYIQTNNDFSL